MTNSKRLSRISHGILYAAESPYEKEKKTMSQQGINKMIVLGHAGNDAELRFTASGKPVANFSVAVNEAFKNANGDNVERVEWFKCVAWNGRAELCGQFLNRGKQVYLEGRLQTRKYDGKDGNARTTTEVVVRTLRLLGGPSNGSSQAQADQAEHPSANGSASTDNTEDIPF